MKMTRLAVVLILGAGLVPATVHGARGDSRSTSIQDSEPLFGEPRVIEPIEPIDPEIENEDEWYLDWAQRQNSFEF